MISSKDSDNEFEHSPTANLDYGFDWAAWLGASQTITSSVWSSSAGLTLTRPQVISNKASIFVSGGVIGQLYKLLNTITTLDSTTQATRTDSRTILLVCKER